MEKKSMRFLSLLLALVMVIGLMPVGHVHAEEGAVLIPGEMVTEVEANETYMIALHGTQKYLTNQAGSGAWGTHTLSMADSSVAEAKNMWTLVPEGDGYKLHNELGYLVLGGNSLDFSETGDIFTLTYHGEEGWAIGAVCGDGTMRYFNHLGGTNYGYTIGGWTGDGTKFDLYTIEEADLNEVDPWGKANWTKVHVDTETIGGGAEEGEFEKAWDDNTITRWHSNWKDGAKDVLTGENTFAGEINFGKEYYINQFSFLPRQDDTGWANGDGVVTMASLYVKDADDTEWKLVAEHQEFEHNQDLKTFTFEAQNVQYVRFVAERSVYNGWVAVAEFYINYEEPAAHEHSYEAVVTDPTCTEGGYTTYTCECGDSYVADETAALGHTQGAVVVENEHPATCTEGGSYDAVFYCTVCGAEISRTAMTSKPNGHVGSDVQGEPATCTEPGLTDGVQCCVCLEWITEQEEIPALGHSYEAVVTAPTCTTFGYTTYTCAACGDSYVADEVDALGHSYESVVTAPTCTEGGYTTYTCTVCGDSYVVDVPALGHTTGEFVVENDVPATCTEDGSFDVVYYCTVCGAEESRETTIVKATGHLETVVSGCPATCEETGLTDGVQCCVCLEWITKQEEIPALGHSYEADVNAPTCTEGGYTTYTCATCGDSYVADEVDALGHTEAEAVRENEKAATCTEAGSYDTVVYCSVCGIELSRETVTVEALGHDYVDGSCVNCGEADPDYVEVIAEGWSGYTTWVLTADGVLTFTPSEQTEGGQTNLKNYWKVGGVLTLPWSAYADQITEVVISDGIHDIGQMAFYELPNLTTITLGADIVEIRNYAFKNCTSLTTINLENVDFIREGAFYGCSALENLSFMDGVVVEDWAFSRTNYASMNP